MEYNGPNLKLYDSVLNHMLDAPTGDVGAHMRRIGLEILTGARALVPVHHGRLRSSLKMTHNRSSLGQYVEVGSNLRYAYVQHEGERPHLIRPHLGRILRFNVGGRMVFAHLVHHPGFRGRQYLTIPLRRAVRR